MDKSRLLSIFGQNLLDSYENEHAFRELTGLSGQKPWECVGEILEAAACLWKLNEHKDWKDEPLVAGLKNDLMRQYGVDALELAYQQLNKDSAEHLIPKDLLTKVNSNAL